LASLSNDHGELVLSNTQNNNSAVNELACAYGRLSVRHNGVVQVEATRSNEGLCCG